MGLAWRVVPDAELLDDIERVASTLAARNPAAVTATKRLLVAGRAEVVRAAMQREYEEMRMLRG